MGLLFVIGVLSILYIYLRWIFGYWERKGVPSSKSNNCFETLEWSLTPKYHHAQWLDKIYKELKNAGHQHGGIYNFFSPGYLPIRPELIRNILQRDFNYFADRGVYYNEEVDPLSAHLYAIGGTKWRKLRTKLTPTFTATKVKMMMEIFVECSIMLERNIKLHAMKRTPFNIKELVACYTTDVIGCCAFGLDFNSLRNKDVGFRKYGRKLCEPDKLRLFFRFILLAAPKLGRLLKLRAVPGDVTDFFFRVVKDTVNYRADNNIYRKDMLQLLIDMKNSDTDDLSIEEVAAQAFVFFGAGFETTSTTMTYFLYEMAVNQTVQDKVREEITTVLSNYNDRLCYEAVLDMTYINQVLEETLRKYPPLPEVTRKCIQDYKVPESEAIIEKDTLVFIPIMSLHYDPEYYPEPEKFNPDRFSPENKRNRLPFTYLPFGEGPRNCLAARFAAIEIIIGVVPLLKNYTFSLSDKTSVPLKLNPKSFILSSVQTIWLECVNIQNIFN